MEEILLLDEKHLKLDDIPQKYKEVFKEEIYKENINRQNLFSIIIFFLTIALLILVNTDFYYKGFDKTPFKIIYTTITFSLLFFYLNTRFLKTKLSSIYGKFIEFSFALFIQLIGICISLSDVNISNQVNPYVISTITIGAMFFFRPFKIFTLLVGSHLAFLFFLSVVALNKEAVNAFYINTTVMLVLSLTLSRVIFTLYLKSFMARKIAEEKIEELQIAHERLLASEKLSSIAKLTGGIAHELNSPLGAILTSTQLLKIDIKTLDNSEDMIENLEVIEKGIKKASGIISKLLKYTNNSENKKEDVNLVELLNQIVSLHSKMYNDIKIDCRFKTDKMNIIGNNIELMQALNNIFTNCVESFDTLDDKHEKKIFIVMDYNSSANDQLLITFEDNGIGINNSNMSKIFDPFFTTKKIGSSMGLGLSLAYEIIKKHNGTITAESIEGNFTKITVVFRNKKNEANNSL